MAKQNIIPLFVPHAGCPNQCVFCDQKKISGAVSPVTPEQVQREIEAALPYSGTGCQLAFYGGSFTAIAPQQQHALLHATQPYLKRGDIASIRVSTRPDAVDDDSCRRLKTYGVTMVELGCQSMDPCVLQLTRRGHTPEDTEKAVACLRRHGFQIILQMMTGLPGDDGQASLMTAKRIISLCPDGVRIYPTVVLRGTELESMMHKGIYKPQTVEEAVSICAQLMSMFRAENIPVIRLGLNPTETLTTGEAVAGAYHPALGELVLSELYLQQVDALIRQHRPIENVVISVHPKRVSVMVGQHRRNITVLQEKFSLKWVKVIPDAEELWEIFLKID